MIDNGVLFIWMIWIANLIAELRTNARAPVAALAKKLRVARGTVQNRLNKLEKDGTILGYTVRLRPQTEVHRIGALMTIAVEGNRASQVIHTLRGDPAVTALHSDQRTLGSRR